MVEITLNEEFYAQLRTFVLGDLVEFHGKPLTPDIIDTLSKNICRSVGDCIQRETEVIDL